MTTLTADYINCLLAEIDRLKARIAALEARPVTTHRATYERERFSPLADTCPDCEGTGWVTLSTPVMTPDGPTERRMRCACWCDDDDTEIGF